MIERALMGDVDINALERLIALKEREDQRNAEAALIQALHNFQQDCPDVVKGRPVYGKDRDKGPQYHFASFADISKTIRPHLEAHGLMFSHTVDADKVTCTVSHRDGSKVQSSFPVLPDEGAPNMNKPQRMASGVSYAKRYSLLGALGIATTDDRDATDIPDVATAKNLKDLKAAWWGKHSGRVPKDEAATAWATWCKDKVFSREISDDELGSHEQWTMQDIQRGYDFLKRVTFDDFAPTLPTLELLIDEIAGGPNEAHARRQLETMLENQTHYGDGCAKVQAAYDKRFPPLSLKG